jgi:hypothetical protein
MTWMSKVFLSVLVDWIDKCWLAYLNEHRNLEGVGEISEELFEIMMDRLEKQWFDLVNPETSIDF